MVVWIPVVAATLAVIAMLATLWFARPGYLAWRNELRSDLADEATLPADLDRVLFKRFWQWLSIVGGIIASITVAAWVLLSSSFGAIAQRTANEAAKDAVARLQAEVQRLKSETEIARENSLEAIRESAEATGRINGAAANAEKTANAAERAANNAASLAVSAQSELSRILQTSELVQAQSRDFSNIEKIVEELAANRVFQEAVISRALDPLEGIVVASTRSCVDLGAGWSVFNEGAGRFIVGVGATTDERGETRRFSIGDETKGAFQHKLIEEEMPSHAHEPNPGYAHWYYKIGGGADHRVTDEHNVNGIPTGYAEVGEGFQNRPKGDNQPHNNMPPYVALHFCKKEG